MLGWGSKRERAVYARKEGKEGKEEDDCQEAYQSPAS